jgi:hypothetical protein
MKRHKRVKELRKKRDIDRLASILRDKEIRFRVRQFLKENTQG